MLRKIRKLILHPNRYFYDYFRKKLGFRKYFVTDKIRLLDSSNHQKWHKALFSHPYLYLYYKFNKRLRKPAYPILVDYRIENIEKSGMGGGNRLVLAVELEKQNTIYFADDEIVQKVQYDKEPYLVGKIFKFNLSGSGNRILLEAGVRFGKHIKINLTGNNNSLYISTGCQLIDGAINLNGDTNRIIIDSSSKILGGVISVQGNTNIINLGPGSVFNVRANIIFKGDRNSLISTSNISFNQGSRILFNKNDNYAYIGANTIISSVNKIGFYGDNALMFICGDTTLSLSRMLITTNVIFFYGYGSNIRTNFDCEVLEGKNILIGSDCMFSHNIHIRNATSHAIYDGDTKTRIAKGDSIIIADHVWLGYRVMIVKGVNIGSGTMIGADSLVIKDLPERCMAAGHPAKVLRENILWTSKGPNNADEAKLAEFETYQEPLDCPPSIGMEKLLKINEIAPSTPASEKAQFIHQLLND